MRLLLDTHVFLWLITGDSRLVSQRQTLLDPANDVFLSVVSTWEISVKYTLGKLPLPMDPSVYLPAARRRHAIESLPLDESSVSQLAILPDLNRDPFDRMLVCQALQHNLTLVTADKVVATYPIATFFVE